LGLLNICSKTKTWRQSNFCRRFQFGTRLAGGKDAASPRYIFTMMSPLTRMIFNPNDDPILKYLTDDNQKIEPEWYIPIIPMVLVNGADGIGTGWMTKIPNYNPREIVQVSQHVAFVDPCDHRPGLPDGIFSYKKYQFW
jgi:DNA topoisomerase-2